jgi:hypothetical protein
MAARAGIGFTPLDNGFAAVDDAAAVQKIGAPSRLPSDETTGRRV